MKIIDGQELTFASILKKLYDEADGKVEIRSSYDCILKISLKADGFKKKVESSLKELISSDIVEKAERIPEELMISSANGDVYGRATLNHVIDLVNVKQLMTIHRLNEVLLTKLNFQPNPNNITSLASFKRWYKRPISDEHLKKLESNIETITTEHSEVRKKFDDKLAEMDKITTHMRKTLTKLDACMGADFNVSHMVLKLRVEKAVQFVTQLYAQQDKIVRDYRAIIQILDQYNLKRMEWTEFLVGIRKTPGGKKIPLPKDAACIVM